MNESNTKAIRDPKRSKTTVQDRPKRAQKLPIAAQHHLKTAQKPPKTPKEGPRPPQEPSLDGLGAILGPINHKIAIQTLHPKSVENCGVDFGFQKGLSGRT